MTEYNDLIKILGQLETEQVNKNSLDIDRLSPIEIVKIINDEDKKAALVVEQQLPQIAQAAQIFTETIQHKGRILYLGAGTSGRLGVLDAAECPPTFGTDPKQIIGVISGGYDTLVLSREGVEDRPDEAVNDLIKHSLVNNDFVIGLAASTRTPYTLAGLQYAKSIGCKTAFIVCNKWQNFTENKFDIDIIIELEVGPEVITGSTRMKSGTAQKMALNMISTTAMILLGKTYGNLMVDLQAKSEKLSARSRKILMDLCDITVTQADGLLNESNGSVKLALVMHKLKCDALTAQEKIDKANGFISKII